MSRNVETLPGSSSILKPKYACTVPTEVLDEAVGKILTLLDPEEAR